MNMSKSDIGVAVYDHHTQAETAVKALQRAGFDMKKISIIGREYETEQHVVGFLNAGDRARIFGKYGAFWGGLMPRVATSKSRCGGGRAGPHSTSRLTAATISGPSPEMFHK